MREDTSDVKRWSAGEIFFLLLHAEWLSPLEVGKSWKQPGFQIMFMHGAANPGAYRLIFAVWNLF